MINLTNNLWTEELIKEHKEQSQRVIDKFKKAFNKNEPEILYHYSKTNSLKSILDSNLFRASKITKLNDYSEYDYGLSLAKKLIQKKNYDSEFTNLLLQGIDSYKDLSTDLFVLSLSRNGDSLPLWQLYSDKNFTGYSFGFDYRGFDFGYSRCHGNVLYSSEEQEEILFALLDEFETYYKKTQEIADASNLSFINEWHWDELVSYFTLFKHSSFNCEEEYRAVYYIWEDDLVKEKNSDKPYIEIPICCNNEERIELPLCEIKVGPKNKKSNDKVRSLFSKYANVKYVDIIPSDIPLRL